MNLLKIILIIENIIKLLLIFIKVILIFSMIQTSILLISHFYRMILNRDNRILVIFMNYILLVLFHVYMRLHSFENYERRKKVHALSTWLPWGGHLPCAIYTKIIIRIRIVCHRNVNLWMMQSYEISVIFVIARSIHCLPNYMWEIIIRCRNHALCITKGE